MGHWYAGFMQSVCRFYAVSMQVLCTCYAGLMQEKGGSPMHACIEIFASGQRQKQGSMTHGISGRPNWAGLLSHRPPVVQYAHRARDGTSSVATTPSSMKEVRPCKAVCNLRGGKRSVGGKLKHPTSFAFLDRSANQQPRRRAAH